MAARVGATGGRAGRKEEEGRGGDGLCGEGRGLEGGGKGNRSDGRKPSALLVC